MIDTWTDELRQRDRQMDRQKSKQLEAFGETDRREKRWTNRKTHVQTGKDKS